jgi:hypothetical protein
MTTTRRGFLLGLGASLVAAPAIVRATSIMPVRRMDLMWFEENAQATQEAVQFLLRAIASETQIPHRMLLPRGARAPAAGG